MLLSVIIPVYNSEKTISKLVEHVLETLDKKTLEIVLVNGLAQSRPLRMGLQLISSKFFTGQVYLPPTQFGEFNAVMCGLNHAVGDYCVMIDDDFQNPLPKFSNWWRWQKPKNFVDVVYSYYGKKATFTFFVISEVGSSTALQPGCWKNRVTSPFKF